MLQFFKLARPDLLSEYRFEVKVPLDVGQYTVLHQHLYQNGLFPKRAFADRTVNSIYFDTFDRNDYADNISGVGDRLKTRIRWYDGNLSALVLERKIKSNKASRKEQKPLTNAGNIYPGERSNCEQLAQENRDVVAIAFASPVFPVLEVQYQRRYFTLGPDLRMTVDTDQMFKRLQPHPQSRFSRSTVHSVVEFKFPAGDRIKMQRMLQNLPFRVFRHSKYVIGTEVTGY